MIDNRQTSESTREVSLPSGRTIVCRPADCASDQVTIHAPSGDVLLEILLTPSGPVLHFHSAQVQLDCAGSFKVRCENFEVQASGDIVHEAGGVLRADSNEMILQARRGNVDVRANDDVNLNGERVRLNC